MFNFLRDFGNYEARVVARFEKGKTLVSTAKVSDGRRPIETGIAHPDYNSGHIVVVQAYDDKATALKGHKQWVKTMTARRLPSKLVDCLNSEISQFCDGAGLAKVFPRKNKRAKARKRGT